MQFSIAAALRWSPPVCLESRLKAIAYQNGDPATMGPNWCLLPPDLLQSIAERFTSLADYIRFRAVCHAWRSASSPHPRHLPIQLPWLMLPYKSLGNYDCTRLFYDLSAAKIHRLKLPETRWAAICGSSHGWLVLHEGQITSLFNPITRATISLPPYTAPPSTLGIAPLDDVHFFENWKADSSAMSPTEIFFVKKAILTSSPLDTSCMAFVLTDSSWELAFCKIGDECWTVIEFHAEVSREWEIYDFSYSNGFLYTVDAFGTLTMYNLINPSRMSLADGIGTCPMYLVDGLDEDVLLVAYGGSTYVDGFVERKAKYTVYKLSNDGKPKWIEVNDVGKNVLFLASGRHALSLSSANLHLPDWGSNCLCYDSKGKQWNQKDYRDKLYNHKIKLARLDNGTVTDMTGALGSFHINLWWEKSLWLTPSLL